MERLKQVCRISIILQIVVYLLFWRITCQNLPWLVAEGNVLACDIAALTVGGLYFDIPRWDIKHERIWSSIFLVFSTFESMFFVYAVIATAW